MQRTERREIETDVVVIGAGIAGLTAARLLAEAARQVVVVEARERVGGRIFTADADGEPVELGAEFVHGKPAELWRLIKEAGLATYELDGAEICRTEEGRGSGLELCEQEMGGDFAWIEELKRWKKADCSFAEYLDEARVPEEQKERLIGYVEGFNAADHRVIGVAALGRQQEAEDAIEGDRLFHVEGGYRQVPEFLAKKVRGAGGQILLEEPVQVIRWQRGVVAVECEHLRVLAKKAIVTLPLGVLQAGTVEWDPKPEAILAAAATMRMGQVQRSVLLFRESPIGAALERLHGPGGNVEVRRLGFLFAFGLLPPVWWTQYPHQSALLTGWVGGPGEAGLTGLSLAELRRRLLETLALAIGANAEELDGQVRGLFTHHWRQDAFSLGAYSYVPAGAMGASEQMGEPQLGTLFFAGEHTDTSGHWGTVHGAMRSGMRAAEQILRS